MDSVPSTSSVPVSPPKKRKNSKIGHLSLIEKQFVLNLYKQIVSTESHMKKTSVIGKIVDTSGISRAAVYRVIKEYKETGEIKSPKQAGGRPTTISNFDDFVKNSIRRIIHGFFYKQKIPTLDKILNEVKTHPELPSFSRSSLYNLMKKINFKYVKRNRKSLLLERDDIIVWRRKYLRAIRAYRHEEKPIYYLDETWLNEGHTKEKIWVDNSIQNKRQAFNEGLTTGLKHPSGKGRRLIVLHVGSKEGFVDGGLLLFEGKKTADYHEEMNSEVFEDWFKKLLKKLPDEAVIVMDNASYHSRKVEKIPTTSSSKKDMQDWLRLKNIAYDEDMVRSELIAVIRAHKENFDLHACDELAKLSNKIVLRLPPYHCELNPIELIWAKIKNEVAAKNTTFKLADVKPLLLQAIENVTSTNWQNCEEHVIKEEERMMTLDGMVDNIVEPLIIDVNNESDSDLFFTTDDDDSE